MTTELNQPDTAPARAQSAVQPAAVEIDMAAVLKVLEESHPDAMRYAMWRVRAEMAEAELAQLKAAQPTN